MSVITSEAIFQVSNLSHAKMLLWMGNNNQTFRFSKQSLICGQRVRRQQNQRCRRASRQRLQSGKQAERGSSPLFSWSCSDERCDGETLLQCLRVRQRLRISHFYCGSRVYFAVFISEAAQFSVITGSSLRSICLCWWGASPCSVCPRLASTDISSAAFFSDISFFFSFFFCLLVLRRTNERFKDI